MGTWAELEISVDQPDAVRVHRVRTMDGHRYRLEITNGDRSLQVLVSTSPEVADHLVAELRKKRGLVPIPGGAA